LGQIFAYLESRNKDTGYSFTFDFKKAENIGKSKIEWVEYNAKKFWM
jgi:hypothetical protein